MGAGTLSCRRTYSGLTLLELIIVISVLAVLVAVALPAFRSFYGSVCVRAAAIDVAGMIREAKQHALDEGDYALDFDYMAGTVTLLSGRGGDGKWNTDDDEIVRSLSISGRAGKLRFGYGSYGPVEGRSKTDDGITFVGNRLVCNDELTGNSGTVYIHSAYGAAAAIMMNSTDAGYKLYGWNGKKWERL